MELRSGLATYKTTGELRQARKGDWFLWNWNSSMYLIEEGTDVSEWIAEEDSGGEYVIVSREEDLEDITVSVSLTRDEARQVTQVEWESPAFKKLSAAVKAAQ